VWLSEGGGMTSRRRDYEDFLRAPVERSTVSVLIPSRRGYVNDVPGGVSASETTMSKQIQSYWNGNEVIKGMWHHGDRVNRLCPSWLLCTQQCCESGSRGTAEECWLGIPSGIKDNKPWCSTGSDADLRHRLPVYNSPAEQNWTFIAGWTKHQLSHWAIPCSWTQGYLPFWILNIFYPGAGVVAGEILESLWAVLNTVTPAMRTATLAHRAEIMDNHMTDSNHKKCLGMGGCQLPRAWVIIHKNLQLQAWKIDFYMHRACPPGQMTIIQTWWWQSIMMIGLYGTVTLEEQRRTMKGTELWWIF